MPSPDLLEPLDLTELTPIQREVSARIGPRAQADADRLLRTCLNYPHFLDALAPLVKRVYDDTSLPERLFRIGCMRTARLYGCEFLWAQGRPACLAAGVSEADLQDVAAGPSSAGLQGPDRVMVLAMDQLHTGAWLSDETWDALRAYGPEGPLDAIAAHALYSILSVTANTFETAPEPGAAGVGFG